MFEWFLFDDIVNMEGNQAVSSVFNAFFISEDGRNKYVSKFVVN